MEPPHRDRNGPLRGGFVCLKEPPKEADYEKEILVCGAGRLFLLGAESDLPCTVEEDELSFTLDFAPAGEEAPVLIRLIPREN